MDTIQWGPVLSFAGLIIGGIGLLIKLGKFETKTDIRLSTLEGKVDTQGADLKGIIVTLARMEGQAQGRAEKKHE